MANRVVRKLFIGTVALAALALAGCRVNPVTGTREFMLVPESQEVQLGHQNHPDIIFMYDGEYHDPELNRYLGTIVMRLHEVSHRPEMPMEFTMLNTSVINAFATPAHVYATRGFLSRLENEAQFAAVMGHELTHVAAGHSAKRLSNNLLVSLAVGAADLAAGESGIGQLAVGAGQAGITLLGLSYSRDQERQADRVGTYYMALAGWDPQQSVTMQKLLQSFNEREPTILDRYLSTHPMSDDRIQQISAVIQQKGLGSGYVQGDGVYEDRWNRRLTRLRQVDKAFEPYDRGMEMLSQKRFDEALGAANQAIANRDDQAPFFRLKGDALLGLGMTDQAKTAYRQSLQVDERYVLANIGLGRAYLAEGNEEAAEREFEKAARDYPGSATAKYGLGTARFKQGRYEEAILPLQNVAAAAPGNPRPHYMLAVSYDKLGETARAYEAYQNGLAAGLGGEERIHAETRVKSLTPTR